LGLPIKEVTTDTIQAEREVKIAEASLDIAKKTNAKAARIKELEAVLDEAKQRYYRLLKDHGEPITS
jgi:hypothetical protein